MMSRDDLYTVPRPGWETSREILVTTSEELVHASESLLDRIVRDGDFPYMSTFSRIHHLGTTLRDCIDALPGSIRRPDPETDFEASGTATRSSMPIAGLCPPDNPIVVENEVDAAQRSTDLHPRETAVVSEHFGTSVPKVLIVDESPFFRLMLISAMEAFGYSTRAVTNLAEMQSTCDSETWNLVIRGSDERIPESHRDWMRGRLAEWNAPLVSLINDWRDPEEGVANHYQFRRTNISAALALIHAKLGPVPLSLRRIA